MSILKRLFGGGTSKHAEPVTTAEIDYKGYKIAARPFMAEGQYQVAGTISKLTDGGEERTHRFIRADRCSSSEDATQITLAKGRQIVDQLGDRMFD
ncbi:MAG TPA: HlyU family transcriptional regulator [Hyphomicrobiaceae bacterium]|nr:HlyU family transcriptional regulator [Hyphomicrobiaceae bacterium]